MQPVRGMLKWSGRPGSNRRHPAWEAGVLPLNYSRSDSNDFSSHTQGRNTCASSAITAGRKCRTEKKAAKGNMPGANLDNTSRGECQLSHARLVCTLRK